MQNSQGTENNLTRTTAEIIMSQQNNTDTKNEDRHKTDTESITTLGKSLTICRENNDICRHIYAYLCSREKRKSADLNSQGSRILKRIITIKDRRQRDENIQTFTIDNASHADMRNNRSLNHGRDSSYGTA